MGLIWGCLSACPCLPCCSLFGTQGQCAGCRQTVAPHELVIRTRGGGAAVYHPHCLSCSACRCRLLPGDKSVAPEHLPVYPKYPQKHFLACLFNPSIPKALFGLHVQRLVFRSPEELRAAGARKGKCYAQMV